jgi:hypothetical protein
MENRMILLESRRVKFQVQYPNVPGHEVELQGTIAILGRDPSCDLVLNDVKCSRRHAVVEAGPQGLIVRDTGSANGVFINNKKVERSSLKDGDVVRLGDVTLTVLPDEMPGTLVMGPDELQEATAVAPVLPLARVPNASQRKTETVPPRARTLIPPRAPARAPAETHRPLTLTVLAMLWMISVLIYPAAGLVTARATGGTTAAVAVGVAVALAVLSGGMAFGLWKRRPWARIAQIAVASVGLLLCPFSLASAAVLAYMLRPVTASHFSGTRPGEPLRPDAAEMTFTGLIMATVLLGTILAAGLLFLFRPSLR